MKKLLNILISFSIIFTGLSVSVKATAQPFKIKVATYNIRLQTSADTAARAWINRKVDVARLIKRYNFDVFGVQEVGSASQKKDLETLIPDYTYFGKGRDNQEGTLGEQIGIFYKTSRFVQKETGYFFLSATPEKMSIGWDAAFRRLCVWTKLVDKTDQKQFYVFCTHFDHIGKTARVESAKLIVERIKDIAGKSPVLFVGDLNTSPESTEIYKILTSYLNDSRVISQTRPTGSLGTFNGYNITTDSLPLDVRIDYIMGQKIKVTSYKAISDRYNKETFPSDHFPVMIECNIQP